MSGLFVIVAALVAAPSAASAAILGFSCLGTGNSAANCATVEAQMTVDITQTDNWLNFKFANSGPAASYIDGVYFSDPPPSLLGGSATIAYSNGGIFFDEDCRPDDLPGNWGTTYCADTNKAQNGVHPGEWVKLSYLLDNADADGVATLLARLAAGDFDIGLKLQGFTGGGSEWAVVNGSPPTTQVPEPGVLLLLTAGLATLIPGMRKGRRG